MADNFLARWLARNAPDREIAEAQQQLKQLATGRPSFQPALLWVCQLLPELTESSQATLADTAASSITTKLLQGIPALRGERLSLDWNRCRKRWQRARGALTNGQATAKAIHNADRKLGELLGSIIDHSPDIAAAMVSWQAQRDPTQTASSDATAAALDLNMISMLARFSFFPDLIALNRYCAPLQESVTWQRGNCPTCGNWPLLAELRGLEQTRFLRCGWCATEWHVPRLYCPYCGNRDHNLLTTRHLPSEENRLRVSVCSACSRYVKTVCTLTALSPTRLWIVDVISLHLDVAAADFLE